MIIGIFLFFISPSLFAMSLEARQAKTLYAKMRYTELNFIQKDSIETRREYEAAKKSFEAFITGFDKNHPIRNSLLKLQEVYDKERSILVDELLGKVA